MRKRSVQLLLVYIWAILFALIPYPFFSLERNIILVPTAIVFAGFYYLARPYFTTWDPQEYPQEELIKTANRSKHHCNYCGNPDLDLNYSTGQYCSLTCLLIATRWVFLGLAFSFYFVTIYFTGFWIAVIIFLIIHLWGVESHRPLTRYRYFNHRKKLREERPELFDEKPENSDQPEITKKDQTPSIRPTGHGTLIIDKLQREVKICCFQTARLKDRYCYCGRVIDDEMIEVVE